MERFVPAEAIAREAVTAALDSWSTGKPPAKIDGGGRSIQVADTHRREGQTLAGYEILGEAPADGGRRFAVRLRLENPESVEKTHYVVLGVDPVWVFRQEDYDMLAHWDHPMPAEDTAPAAASESQPPADQPGQQSPEEPSIVPQPP